MPRDVDLKVLMVMLLPFCADLPASLLQKFNAAAGNHSKKPQPKVVHNGFFPVVKQFFQSGKNKNRH